MLLQSQRLSDLDSSILFQRLQQNKDPVNCKSNGNKNADRVVARVTLLRVSRFLLAGAVGLDADSAVTVDGNTSFVGNSAGGDGGEYNLVNVRLYNSCNVRLCLCLSKKVVFNTTVHNAKRET